MPRILSIVVSAPEALNDDQRQRIKMVVDKFSAAHEERKFGSPPPVLILEHGVNAEVYYDVK